ncbi:MAG: type II secretion system minor pseudopilin GspK [Nevskiales bacterium]
MSQHQDRQRGVALITALLIVALAALLASGMLNTQNLSIHRSGNLIAQEQAWWYAIGAENWASKVLERDQQDNQTDDLTEDWATALDFLPVEGGFLKGEVSDQQGLFNLNNLAGTSQEQAALQLGRLLTYIEGVDAFIAPALAKAITDWIDIGTEADSADAAEDDYYLSLRQLPYRTANRPLASVSELRLIRGITPEIYGALEPYVTALPDTTPINVNTAPPEILASLAPELTREAMQPLIAKRETEPFKDAAQFLAEPVFAGRQIESELLSVDSNYFQLQVTATVGTTRVTLYSLLRRDQGGVETARRSRDSP